MNDKRVETTGKRVETERSDKKTIRNKHKQLCIVGNEKKKSKERQNRAKH